MLQAIKNFFNSSMSPAPEAKATAASKDIRLAACALLLELANADDQSARGVDRITKAFPGSQVIDTGTS